MTNNSKTFSNAKYILNKAANALCATAGKIKLKYFIGKYNPPFKVDQCEGCGFMFMNPRFTDKTINSFYSEGYFKGSAEYSYYDEREALKYASYVWDARLKNILKYSQGGNFLDIGCSFGGFLSAASRYFTPYGIELSRYAGAHAGKTFGKNIHVGTIENHPFKKNFFSVITMVETIEHVKNPLESMRECYKMLKKNGILLIQTANMDGAQAKLLKDRYAYFMPGHLSYFTKKNLTGSLKKTGFTKVIVYQPVDFGLRPKLLKSRYSFKNLKDYRHWIRISLYHLIGKLSIKNFSAASSMVVYAVK